MSYLCEACSEPCGVVGEPMMSGRCQHCGAAGYVSDERPLFVTARVCTCHLDEDECEAHNEWRPTLLAELQLQVESEARRQSTWQGNREYVWKESCQ